MKKIFVVMAALLITLGIAACQQKQEQTQNPVSYAPAVPPMPSQIEQMQQAAKATPANVASWINLGNSLMDSKRFGEAVEAYEKALSLDPKNVPVLVDQGTCYRGIGKFDKAVELYQKALKIDPNFPYGHRNLGIVLAFDLNRKTEAIKEFRRYLELEPTGDGAEAAKQALQQLTGGQ